MNPLSNMPLSAFQLLLTSYRGNQMLEKAIERYARRARISSNSLPFALSDMPKPLAEQGNWSSEDRGEAGDNEAPLFITGRFRSGSTLMWSLFDQASASTAYYEPLNEAKWFEERVSRRQDPTHKGANDYAHTYEGLGDLNALYNDRWTDTHLYMDGNDSDLNLVRYIDALIKKGGTASVLQFNRTDFRLAFLRAFWPSAKLIHIYRDVRQSWISVLGKETPTTANMSLDTFEKADRFYLLNWWRDLSRTFPFLQLDGREHPYLIYYLIWRLSAAFGQHYAGLSISYEALIQDPISHFQAISNYSGITLDASTATTLISPHKAHEVSDKDSELFEELETLGDRILRAADLSQTS